jgi:hypothetical protein
MAFFHLGDAQKSRGFLGSPFAASCGGRAVILVAGMNIPEAAREAVLARVTAEFAAATERPPEASVGAGEGKGGWAASP